MNDSDESQEFYGNISILFSQKPFPWKIFHFNSIYFRPSSYLQILCYQRKGPIFSPLRTNRFKPFALSNYLYKNMDKC